MSAASGWGHRIFVAWVMRDCILFLAQHWLLEVAESLWYQSG